MTSRRAPAFAVVMVLAGANLRAPITSVSTSLPQIEDHYSLTTWETAALVALPVVMFSVAAPAGPWLRRRIGGPEALVVLQLVLGASLALRVVDTVLLLVGTLVAGATITASSVLATAQYRQSGGHVGGRLTAAFTMMFGVGAALGAWLTPRWVADGMPVPYALALWSLPAFAACLLLVLTRPRRGDGIDSDDHRVRARQLLRDPAPWFLAGFFGLQALVFFTTNGWFAALLQDRGLSPTGAGDALTVASLAGLPATLLAPRIAERVERRRATVLVIAAGTALGLGGLSFAPVDQAVLWAALLGLAQGGAFAVSLTLVVWRAADGPVAATLSATTQGIGYAIAAAGPLLVGVSREWSGSWGWPVVALLVVVAIEAVVACLAAVPDVIRPQLRTQPQS